MNELELLLWLSEREAAGRKEMENPVSDQWFMFDNGKAFAYQAVIDFITKNR